ncbi:MAG: ribose-phosphate diphosphokinase [Methanobrevibacter sp.]|nr:ribose-phosphate diphosphokinase [Candidatus Methanovirga meridionalis]
MIIGGSASQNLTAKIAELLNDEVCPIEIKKFPDGEKYIRIKGKIEEEMILIQSTGYPQDENLMELLFLISNLKDLGAKKIKVVVPYFGYGRQEKRFKNGEAISAKIISNLIEIAGATEFFSLNLHEDSLKDFFSIPAHNLSAMPVITEHIKENTENPIIVSPDKGGLGFTTEIANILKCESTYLSKVRISPDKVETRIVNMINNKSKVDISLVEGKEVILVDDIISTGGTIVNATKIVKKHGAKSVDVYCVHPVLVNDAVLKIYGAGVRNIIGTDTLTSDVSHISVANIITNKILEKEN